MTPRWWDWIVLTLTLCGCAVWIHFGMPGLPNELNPLRLTAARPVVLPLAPAPAPPEAILPPASDQHAVAMPPSSAVPPVVLLAVKPDPPPPEAPPPPPRPRMPEVIRPSGGDSEEGHTQSASTASTLPVIVYPSGRSQPIGAGGTGFFIAHDGSIMTVAHVVRACKRITISSRHVKETPAKLLATDVGNDVAVLLSHIRPPAVLSLADRPYGAESLEIFGYPADGDALVPTQAHGRMRTDRPSFAGLENLDRRDMLWIDSNTVRAGFSGGPVLNPGGGVVGLINGQVMRHTSLRGVIVRDTKFVYAATTRTIHTFLSQEVPLLVPDAGQSLSPEDVDKAIVRVICLH
jgi:hypothetical protein